MPTNGTYLWPHVVERPSGSPRMTRVQLGHEETLCEAGCPSSHAQEGSGCLESGQPQVTVGKNTRALLGSRAQQGVVSVEPWDSNSHRDCALPLHWRQAWKSLDFRKRTRKAQVPRVSTQQQQYRVMGRNANLTMEAPFPGWACGRLCDQAHTGAVMVHLQASGDSASFTLGCP